MAAPTCWIVFEPGAYIEAQGHDPYKFGAKAAETDEALLVWRTDMLIDRQETLPCACRAENIIGYYDTPDKAARAAKAALDIWKSYRERLGIEFDLR